MTPTVLGTGGRRRVDPGLVGVLVLAGAVRLAWCLAAARRPEVAGDPFTYLFEAEAIADGQGYRAYFFGTPTAYYPVGYPVLLGGALWLARAGPFEPTVVQVSSALNVLAGVLTAWCAIRLGARFGNRRTAVVAGLVTALAPGLVLYSATAHLETVFTALVAAIALVAAGRTSDDLLPTRPRLAALGLLFAAATYVRPIVLPGIVLLAILWRRGGWPWARALRATASVAAVVAVALAPWAVRNTDRMGGLVLLSTNTGDNLCVGHSDFSSGHYHDLTQTCWVGFDDVPVERLELERDRTNTRRALSWAARHPVQEVELLVKKAYYLLEHDHEGLLAVESYGAEPFLEPWTRTAIRWTADLAWYALLVASALGWARRRADGTGVDPGWRWLAGWAVVLLAVPLVFFGGARFHIPAVPLLAVLASTATIRHAPVDQEGGSGRGTSGGRPSIDTVHR